MQTQVKRRAVAAVLGGMIVGLAAPAAAQTSGLVTGVGDSQLVTAQARVQAIDPAARKVTLLGSSGNSFVVKAGPEVRNFDRIQVGDMVVARFYNSLFLVLSRGGTRTPSDEVVGAAVRAAQGQLPEAAVAQRMVVTGTVVGVNTTANTISLVDPAGGEVRTMNVTDPQRQAQLKQVKVGDSITAVLTDALAVSLDPA